MNLSIQIPKSHEVQQVKGSNNKGVDCSMNSEMKYFGWV